MSFMNRSLARWTALGVFALAPALGFVASADAQVRDRGDRYQRAQSDSRGRSRTRSADNTRFERPSADFTRSRSTNYERNDYRPPQRTVYQDRDRNDFRRVETRRDYDRDRSYRSNYRDYRDYRPRSTFSVGVSYRAPVYTYRHYDYRPYTYVAPYRPYEPYRSYDYRPSYRSYYDPYRPAYGSRYYYAPAPRVIYDYYPLGYDCGPIFGVSYGVRYSSHGYPRYGYPRSSSGLSIGIRYDYRR